MCPIYVFITGAKALLFNVVFLILFNRERLIHLLALRPYKKPELWARINSGKCRNKCIDIALYYPFVKSISV